MSCRYFNIRLLRLMMTIIGVMLFPLTQAQDYVVNNQETYDTKEKIQSLFGTNYKMETKGGKLHIQHTGNLETINQYVFRRVEHTQECFDLSAELEMKFDEADENSGFGMEFATLDDANKTYHFFFEFLIMGDGKIKFTGDTLNTKILNAVIRPCPSFKLKDVNNFKVTRNGAYWTLLVNNDTVCNINQGSLNPIAKGYTGNFRIYGKCDVQIDNYNFIAPRNIFAETKKVNKLASLEGTYLVFSTCLKNETKRITINLKHEGNSKMTITGLGEKPVIVYLDERIENIFLHTITTPYVFMGGVRYSLRKLRIEPLKNSSRYNITFNLYGEDATTSTNCDFDGDQNR